MLFVDIEDNRYAKMNGCLLTDVSAKGVKWSAAKAIKDIIASVFVSHWKLVVKSRKKNQRLKTLFSFIALKLTYSSKEFLSFVIEKLIVQTISQIINKSISNNLTKPGNKRVCFDNSGISLWALLRPNPSYSISEKCQNLSGMCHILHWPPMCLTGCPIFKILHSWQGV